jgi:hypothetical protein
MDELPDENKLNRRYATQKILYLSFAVSKGTA